MPENMAFLHYPESWKMSIDTVKEWLDRKKDFVLLDVREEFERELAKIEPSQFIPINQLKERIGEIPKNKPIVVYCHHGMRSLRAVDVLRANGRMQSFSMNGGIDEWSQRIDPLHVKRYVK